MNNPAAIPQDSSTGGWQGHSTVTVQLGSINLTGLRQEQQETAADANEAKERVA